MLNIVLGLFGLVVAGSMLAMWKTYQTARFAAAVEAEDARLDWIEGQIRQANDEPYDLDNMD